MKIRMKRRDRDILLLVLAAVLVIMLWGPIWYMIKLAVFVVAIYLVYQLLRATV
ncbi:MAG TPA: hypothetical protein PLI05_02775 [Methanotrichaceae archaeon]|nr:hypothetical protein [Methanotrichaceae archaeon]HQF15975.1 hypothetical protein [Methanotrichaceae archaeon]HQI90677.1 hypothetical protein [Methanotrichaceae archaeon]